MIEFPCRCGHRMRVEDDQAGSDLQCTQCGLLLTVPTLSDRGRVSTVDGTYALDDSSPAHLSNEDRLQSLHQAFTRNTTSADGSEIDNRVTFEDLALAGEIPLVDETERPKYDPVTGELMRPLQIKVDPAAPVKHDEIPMARAAITYAAATPRSTNLRSAMVLLSSPGNLAVLGIMFVLHLFLQGVVVASLMFFFVAFIGIFVVFGVVGHFANVIDEIGPRDMDELPRPMRDLQIGEDLWSPFVHIFVAAGLCLLPAMLVLHKLPLPPVPMTVALTICLFAGVVAFPGLLLTTATSGSFLNLRPDRVLSVAKANGPGYLGLIFLGIFSLATYVVGNVGAFLWLATKPGVNGYPLWVKGFISYPMMALGIYMMHLFCWRLGLYYREHHGSFDWVYQRHVKQTPASEDPAIRAARRAAQKRVAMARRNNRVARG